MDFHEWLLSRDIDIESIETEMLDTLRRQFVQHLQRLAPVAESLVQPSDCLHPKRTYRVAAIVTDAANAGLLVTRASDLST